MNKILFSSEAVGVGHPDKICDQISDAILDAYLEKDKHAKVACEVFASNRLIVIGGEITSTATVNLKQIALSVLENVGYTELDFKIQINTNVQSVDIFQAVEKIDHKSIGAGDQGIIFGYATDETENFLPLAYTLANKILQNIEIKIRNKEVDYLLFDMKSQVTIDYTDKNPKIHTFLVSIQHKEDANMDELRNFISNEMLLIAKENNLNTDFNIIINPSGKFVIGGPIGDTGLTGRKIIVDTYGGAARHGGGAFSGKDPTKVDRSAAYFARYIAKSIVASKLAKRCEIQLAFGIGITKPISISINTFGTSSYTDNEILDIVKNNFNFDIYSFINELNLFNVKYLPTAVYGHFGKKHTHNTFTWENYKILNKNTK